MALGSVIPAFVWGEGGAKLTPEEVARQRKVLEALAGKTDTSPVGHWSQGLARVADAFGDVVQDKRLDAAEKKNSETNSDLISRLLAGTGTPASSGPVASAATSGVAGELAATSPAVSSGEPIDLTGNEVFTGFIDTVKQGGVTNPYALAAIAATGKAESGFSPGNVNRTWADPSESGQPGTAGGIMSWRGPRYQALAATGDLSPQGQAKFFLQENPQLIAALNNAQSVEEAQTLMNNAWKFAGYDRPGGEAARRLSLANSFLPTFQGQGEVAALTPEAAIEAVAPASGTINPPAAPAFDAGRFGDPINLAEMPPSAAQLPGSLVEQGANYAPPLPPPTTIQDRPVASVAQALTAPVEVAQAGQGYFPPPPAPPSEQGINPAIIEALSSPYADEQTKRIAGLLLGQELERQAQSADPMRALELEKARLELEAMRNPQPKTTAEMQNLAWRAEQAGLQPGTPEYAQFMLSGGDKGITVDARQMGNIPPGYQVEYNEAGNPVRMVPIPGSPADMEAQAAQAAQDAKAGQANRYGGVVVEDIDRAVKAIETSPAFTTGIIGSWASNIPGTGAAKVARLLDTVKANAGFDRLQAMRESSPTGGALGSVTERELSLLQAAIGSLEQSQDADDLVYNLRRVQDVYDEIINGPKASRSGKGGRVNKPITEMTDEELEAIINGD